MLSQTVHATQKLTPQTAFTRTELLVVIFGLLVCGAVLLLLQTARQAARARRLQCLNNMKQLMSAVSFYTHDNDDFFPPNPDDGNTHPGYNWCPGQAGRGAAEEFDTRILGDPSRCLIAPYLRSNVSVFRCTMDTRRRKYTGTNTGPVVYAARTISMNGAVGTVDPAFSLEGSGHSGKPKLSVNAPWLNNAHTHRRNRPWRTYGKTTEIIAPVPSSLFVLAEEDPDSVNDACFSFGMQSPVWFDLPGGQHEKSGLLAFADGHAEVHRWMDARTIPKSHLQLKLLPPRITLERQILNPIPVPESPDWLWLSTHTSAKATTDQKGTPQH